MRILLRHYLSNINFSFYCIDFVIGFSQSGSKKWKVLIFRTNNIFNGPFAHITKSEDSSQVKMSNNLNVAPKGNA